LESEGGGGTRGKPRSRALRHAKATERKRNADGKKRGFDGYRRKGEILEIKKRLVDLRTGKKEGGDEKVVTRAHDRGGLLQPEERK